MASHQSNQLELLIFHYNRNHYEQKHNQHIPIALKHVMIEFSKKIFPSNILSFKQDLDLFTLLTEELNDRISSKHLNLLYRASEHNFTSKSFHDKCDNHGPTITIIESNYGNIFGAYVKLKWPSEDEPCHWSGNNHHYSNDMFIFLVKSNKPLQKCPIIFKKTHYHSQAPFINHEANRGFVIGACGIHNISIGNKCNEEVTERYRKCYTYKVGYDYNKLKGTLCGAPSANSKYERKSFFKVIEYEVFEIK